jgi:hypothetical protein
MNGLGIELAQYYSIEAPFEGMMMFYAKMVALLHD